MIKDTKQEVDVEVLNEDLENYFANTIIPQLFVDAKMILRKFTPPAMKQFSLSAGDIGRNIADVQDNIRYPTLIENITEVIGSGEILEKEVQTTDRRWFQMNILPYIERRNHRTNGVIITFVDITARLALLKELEKLNADHTTVMFALSHDLRQPLSTMLMVTDELSATKESIDQVQLQEWAQILKRASATMKEMVNDFTQHIAVRDEALVADARLNIGHIFDDVIMALREEIHRNSVSITTSFDVTELIFPRNNLRSIVYNLLGNAIKYRKPEEPLHIRISTVKVNDHVMLSVSDDGMGIAPEHHDRVFHKYTRLNTTMDGTGMGLYIVKRMLETRGDRIELESEEGKGSTFRVFIHVEPVAG